MFKDWTESQTLYMEKRVRSDPQWTGATTYPRGQTPRSYAQWQVLLKESPKN